MLKVFKPNVNEITPFIYEYFLSVPSDYNKDDKKKKWPFILFLHGLDESHPPIEKVLNHGPPKLIHAYSTNREGDTLPSNDINLEAAKFLAENFVTCSPQLHQGCEWNNEILIRLIDQIQDSYNIDENKMYLSGISMGKFSQISFKRDKLS